MGGPGLLDRIRRLGGSGLEWAELRLALLANGLAFEKLRLIEALAWLAAALVSATVGVLLLVALALLLVDEAWRLPLLGLLALGFLGAAAWAWRTALDRLQGGEPPFAALREELARDRAALMPADDEARR
ncbi:MAG: phage holin family protein [Burkholderiaceae bacterium]|nr:phage holin family protein [Burkholderiaceae bacterium]MCZ8174423.1 phage holin family protein [Burkholderiaceae bacterium]